jgi:hypothetical protein
MVAFGRAEESIFSGKEELLRKVDSELRLDRAALVIEGMTGAG